MSRFVSCSKVFPSVCYLFSQFSQAGIVSRKGHKFSAYGLELAQPFLNTVFLLSKLGKKVAHTWKNFSHGKLDNYRNKYYFSIDIFSLFFLAGMH